MPWGDGKEELPACIC